VSRIVFVCLFAQCLLRPQGPAERPITALPYTPALDPAFLDRSVDPCADFYRFACGNWNRLNPIPPDQARWDVYAKLQDDNRRFLWGILEEAAKPSPNRSPSEQKIGDFFAACMDEAAIEKAGASGLQKTFDHIAAVQRLSDIPPVVAELHMVSGEEEASALFGFGSGQDYSNSNREIAFASAGGLGLPDRDYYVKTGAKSQEIRARYVEHVAHTLALVGDSPATAKSEAQIVMEIETALAKASLTRVEQRDPYKLFHKYTAAQLMRLTPSFNWDEYWKGVGLATPAEINVTEPVFFKEVEKQLRGRPISSWKIYLRWHAVASKAPFLSSAFVQADFEFNRKYLRGVAEIEPRWKRCVRDVDVALGEALGQVFAARTFSPDTKAKALAMTKEIEKAMETDLQQISWMSGPTRKEALEKLHTVVNKVGYPDKWRDYSAMHVEPDDFLGDVQRAQIFESKRQLAKIGKPVDRAEWQITPPTVDAYYDPQMNDINFPAGVLQPPLFDPKMDDAPNYGDTGGTIGHELTHGFDDEGRRFDASGNLRDWWTKKDADEFVKRAACISDQYSQYTVVDNVKINGKLTLGEDAADLGGEILAYMAWKDATAEKALQPVDGFSPEQRFFIGMAQWACGDERPEQKRLNAITNPHSPDEYRVNGVVSNLPEFAAAFACKAGQPMVRAHACRVW
jgi:putative endopeptidase